MLKRIRVKNYRKFSDFTINLTSKNIMVGPNNAGKSALIDSLRILQFGLRYAIRKRPKYDNLDLVGHVNFYEIEDSSLPISLENINHNYGNDDAVIEYLHTNGSKAYVLLHPDRITRFGVDANGMRVSTGADFCKSFPLDLVIVPTIMPFLAEENYVTDNTLKKNEGTRVASRNFRNYWYRKTDKEFYDFAKDVSLAWPEIIMNRPELDQHKLTMFYSENRIDREINWSGFGFQVWLQILTHLQRSPLGATVVIDEPDIYLHPDLQKKLVKLLGERYAQFILATHSVEIINCADGKDIVSVNPGRKQGYRLKTNQDFEEIYGYIGAADNADYARIAKVRKVVFFEGNDRKTYSKFAKKFGFNNLANDAIPFVKLGVFFNGLKQIT